MAKKDERFVRVYSQGNSFGMMTQIWVDKVTGVNYLYQQSGYSGGLTPLLCRLGYYSCTMRIFCTRWIKQITEYYQTNKKQP